MFLLLFAGTKAPPGIDNALHSLHDGGRDSRCRATTHDHLQQRGSRVEIAFSADCNLRARSPLYVFEYRSALGPKHRRLLHTNQQFHDHHVCRRGAKVGCACGHAQVGHSHAHVHSKAHKLHAHAQNLVLALLHAFFRAFVHALFHAFFKALFHALFHAREYFWTHAGEHVWACSHAREHVWAFSLALRHEAPIRKVSGIAHWKDNSRANIHALGRGGCRRRDNSRRWWWCRRSSFFPTASVQTHWLALLDQEEPRKLHAAVRTACPLSKPA
mmetsp:Transcript_867/g.1590  ORF Transcript_867/g.1590 Transcript_867/m.1590 type:complete len:272 (-) Transcript_867:108-923(-)